MRLVVIVGIIAAMAAGFAYLRRRDLEPPPGLTYEEEDPDGLFAGFGLSEGLAAESAPSAFSLQPSAFHRDATYAAMAIMSSTVSFSTTCIMSGDQVPLRVPCWMSYSWRTR